MAFLKHLSFHTRFVVYAFLALALIGLDQHFYFFQSTKRSLDWATYSVQLTLSRPIDWLEKATRLLVRMFVLDQENHELHGQILQLKSTIGQLNVVQQELNELNQLLSLSPTRSLSAYPVGKLYSFCNRLTYKVIFNKGMHFHLQNGQPVVDGKGLLGQITRVYPQFSVVTLIVSKGQMLSVMLARTGERTIIYGTGGSLRLPYWPLESDIQKNDLFVTSGIDGVYPAGLAVAIVNQINKPEGADFARLNITPLAGIFRSSYAMAIPFRAVGIPLPLNDKKIMDP
jgi:rod shape-determining protein MreC